MRVAFDDQIFAIQRRGGISRYFTEMIRQFRANPGLGIEPVLPFRFAVNEHLLELGHTGVHRSPLPRWLDRPRAVHALNAARLTTPSAEILHHTYYTPAALTSNAKVRVCTVYDMIPELFPEQFPHGNPHQAKREVVAACDAVICISETTRRDLVRFYGEFDKPVVVTHLAVGREFFDAAPRVDIENKYFLFVGQRAGYKNFSVVLDAFADVARRIPSFELLCVGGGPFTAAEVARTEELGLVGRVRQRQVPDGELPGVYASAVCFVFPSKYEGFGLPVLEAMAAGCPVVVAETACLLEVAEDAAASFDPENSSDLAGILTRAAADPDWSANWRGRGRVRAADFSWAHTAQQTAALYRRVIPSTS